MRFFPPMNARAGYRAVAIFAVRPILRRREDSLAAPAEDSFDLCQMKPSSCNAGYLARRLWDYLESATLRHD
jgi:hypothetical protein